MVRLQPQMDVGRRFFVHPDGHAVVGTDSDSSKLAHPIGIDTDADAFCPISVAVMMVKRVAALAGDEIGIEDGILVISGQPRTR
jgi:type IV secretory pathway protease TraF